MIFNKSKTKLDEIIEAQAKSFGLDLITLKGLYQDKICPKYGQSEPLHIRKVRGGKTVVFNISEKYRSEKISQGRKKTAASSNSADATSNENNNI